MLWYNVKYFLKNFMNFYFFIILLYLHINFIKHKINIIGINYWF